MNKSERQAQKLQAEIDAFNQKNKVGDQVTVVMDDGSEVQTTITHEATILGGHTAVGWFADIRGAYLLERVKLSYPTISNLTPSK